jgi:hypothetical protein
MVLNFKKMNLQRILYNCNWPLLFFLFCTALFGCERELDVDVDVEPPVVVNALFNTDSTWRVRVTRAWAMGEAIFGQSGNAPVVGEDRSKNILNASVHITSGGGEQIVLDYDTNGFYLSSLKPRPGEAYTLSVDVPGELPIASSVVLPEPVWPDTAYFTRLSDYDYLFTLEFTDPPGPTAYELNLYEGTSGSLKWAEELETGDQDVYVEYYWTPLYAHPDEGGAGLGPIFWALNDRNFQGKKKTLVFHMGHFDQLSEDWTVQMRTVSDEYARYRTTALQQQESYNDPFAQPTQVFNNIKNGVGIFAGYSVVYYHFKVN